MSAHVNLRLLVVSALLNSTSARAEEMLVHDGPFTLDVTGDHDRGFYWFNQDASLPADWTSPHDYFNGEWQVRFEILNQASNDRSHLQICIWQDSHDKETCSSHVELNGPGDIATAASSPASWWTLDNVPVDFSRPLDIDHLGTPLWNESFCIVSDYTTSYCWDDHTNYFPFTARMTVVAVSAGSTFSGWDNYINGTPPPPPPPPPPPTSVSFPFTHHFIADRVQLSGNNGRFGAAALGDFDRDGDLDYALGNGDWEERTLWWFEYQGPDNWVRHNAGTMTRTKLGGLAHDVNGDGWLDIVTSNYWYENTQDPRNEPFTAHAFLPEDPSGHDVVVADINGDGKEDVVQMFDEADIFHWYDIPADPTEPWPSHRIINEGLHASFGPNGIGDIDGDTDLDIVRTDVWLENNGDGTSWTSHPLPFGTTIGPWGPGSRAVVVDMDEDGANDIVLSDCDGILSTAAVLYNDAGDGSHWIQEMLPLTSPGGRNSLHSLRVADFNHDGRLDILAIEQEDLRWVTGGDSLPTPRWFIWEDTTGVWVEHVILDANLGGHEAFVGDVDADGDVDIVAKTWVGYADGYRDNANNGYEHADFMENRMIDRLDNGYDLNGWQATGGDFSVENGVIVAEQGPNNSGGLLLSDREYGDFILEAEVWPDWGIDSGLFLRTEAGGNAFQVCIDYQPDNPMGGLYGAGINNHSYWESSWDFTVASESTINGSPALFAAADWSTIWKVGDWNHFRARIEGNPPRIEVWINETKVTDHQETEELHGAIGKIGLQVHDGPGEWPDGAVVRFRNVKVYDLSYGGINIEPTPDRPTINITAPTNGSTFREGTDITITASAHGGESAVSKVVFSADGTPLGEDQTAPHSFVYTAPALGSHTIVARMTTADGTAIEDSVTIQVAAAPAESLVLEAEEYDTMSGITSSGTYIESCDDGDYITFEQVDLGTGYNELVFNVGRPSDTTQVVEVRLDNKDNGELIATFTPAGTGDWYTFQEQATATSGATGVHDLYFVFKEGWGVGNFDWFRFQDPNGFTPTEPVDPTPPTDPNPGAQPQDNPGLDSPSGSIQNACGCRSTGEENRRYLLVLFFVAILRIRRSR